jgi:hypothetical protein
MIACAPGLMPYLISKRFNRRECFKLALIFNAPRIIILTISGIIVAYLAFLLTEEVFKSMLTSWIGNAQLVGYGILGAFIFLFGAHMFLTSVETQEDLKDAKAGKRKKKRLKKGCESGCADNSSKIISGNTHCDPIKPKRFGFVQRKFMELQKKPGRLFLIWGGILSMACLGEILLVEMPIISGAIGVTRDTFAAAAFFGGFSMFLFAMGASVPIIVVAVVSGSVEKYFKTVEKVESIRTIGSMVMIMVGLGFVIWVLSVAVSNFIG